MLNLFLLSLTEKQEECFITYEYHYTDFVVIAANPRNARILSSLVALNASSDNKKEKIKEMWLCGARCTRIGRTQPRIKKEKVVLSSCKGE